MNPDLTAREMLAQLEAMASHEDAVMGRAIEALRQMIEDRRAIESLQDRMLQASMARTGFIVELAAALTEHEQGCTILQLFRKRRPALRCIQGGLQ